MEKVGTVFKDLPGPWTAGVALPGGDFPVDGVAELVERLQQAAPFLASRDALRLVRAYGTEAFEVKLGLRMQAEQIVALDEWMLRQRGGASAAAE